MDKSEIIYHYPDKGESYSPKGVADLFRKAAEDEKGDIAAILGNKHKYKELLELWHASFLAVAINKWLGKKFQLRRGPNNDTPDVFFLDQDKTEAFPVEIRELFIYKNVDSKIDYEKLAKEVWETKGKKDLENYHLLLINRIPSSEWNVPEFCRGLSKLSWKLERIWLGLFTESNVSWMFFEMLTASVDSISSITVAGPQSEDKEFWY